MSHVSLRLLGLLLLTAPALALDVGEAFPTTKFPLLGEAGKQAPLSSIENFRGRKTLLHIFASW
ncbi:MAG: hypothetical protein AAF517_03825 [Planctomycetota bacterium]